MRVIAGALIIVLVLSVGAMAFQNEPDGFRGLKWGNPPTEEMEYLDDLSGNKNYVLPDEKMSIGSTEFWMIIYAFYEDRFFKVALYFDGEDNYDLLETICKEVYGTEELDEEFYRLMWIGQRSFIGLSYDAAEEVGSLLLSSAAITLEKTEADNKKEAKKAEGDW